MFGIATIATSETGLFRGKWATKRCDNESDALGDENCKIYFVWKERVMMLMMMMGEWRRKYKKSKM